MRRAASGFDMARPVALMLALGVVGAGAGPLTYERIANQWQYAHTMACDAGGPTGACGPNEWIQVPGSAECGESGTQSPIDLAVDVNLNSDFEESLSLKFFRNGSCCSGNFILNPHTCEVNIEETCPKTSYVLRPDGKEFFLKRFDFHSPSEHTWNGKYFPLEVHMVHQADDGQTLIVAVLFAVGTPTDEDMDRVGFLEKVLNMIPEAPDVGTNEDGSEVEEPNYVEQEKFFENLDVYGNLVEDAEFLYHYTGSSTTPPCTTNTEWYFLTEAMMGNQFLLDEYRHKIQSTAPANVLAPWGMITEAQDPDAVPPFDESAGDIVWNASQGCNNRPIQPLVGASNLNREVRRTGAELQGKMDKCPEEEEGTGISLVMLVLMTAGLCCFIVGGVAGCVYSFQYCKPKAKTGKRSLKARSKVRPEVAPAPSAPSQTSETAPLMLATPLSTPAVSFSHPQMVYAAPPVQMVQAVQMVPTPVAYAPQQAVQYQAYPPEVQYQAIPSDMQPMLLQQTAPAAM